MIILYKVLGSKRVSGVELNRERVSTDGHDLSSFLCGALRCMEEHSVLETSANIQGSMSAGDRYLGCRRGTWNCRVGAVPQIVCKILVVAL
jgi:hypothetical protein